MQVQRSFRWLFLTLAVVGFAADQASKYLVFRSLHTPGDIQGRMVVVDGYFELLAEYDLAKTPSDGFVGKLQTWSGPVMPRVNHGALFGMGNQHKGLANQVFAGVSVLAAGGVLFWGTRRATGQDRWLSVALGLILGGTLGNLYDRVLFNGVRDFLHYFGGFEWPVFNVADCCLVCGAAVLMAQAVFNPTPTKPADTLPPPTSEPAAVK